MTAVPGVTIDYGFVAKRLAEVAERCDLRMIRYDRWRIELLKKALTDIGVDVPLEACGQGYHDMAPSNRRSGSSSASDEATPWDAPCSDVEFCKRCDYF